MAVGAMLSGTIVPVPTTFGSPTTAVLAMLSGETVTVADTVGEPTAVVAAIELGLTVTEPVVTAGCPTAVVAAIELGETVTVEVTVGEPMLAVLAIELGSICWLAPPAGAIATVTATHEEFGDVNVPGFNDAAVSVRRADALPPPTPPKEASRSVNDAGAPVTAEAALPGQHPASHR